MKNVNIKSTFNLIKVITELKIKYIKNITIRIKNYSKIENDDI